MTIKGCFPIVQQFLGENAQSPVTNGPKTALIWGNWGVNVGFYVRYPEKAYPCACFGVFYVKIRPGALAVASCKNRQKKKKTSRVNTFGTQSHVCAETKRLGGS